MVDVFLREMTEIYCSLEIFLGYMAVLSVLGSTLHVRGVRRSTFWKSAHLRARDLFQSILAELDVAMPSWAGAGAAG
jgi:hypothetical protein